MCAICSEAFGVPIFRTEIVFIDKGQTGRRGLLYHMIPLPLHVSALSLARGWARFQGPMVFMDLVYLLFA